MMRLLKILAIAVALAAVAAWMADNPGHLSIDWRGYRIESSFLLLFVLMAALYLLIRLPFWAYARWRGASGQLARQRRGNQALGLGMTAIAAGDALEAKRQAGRAQRLLGGGAIPLLMQAQAAQLAGDETAARDHFLAMLGQPETEFLGLRGLLAQAIRQGDLSYAGRLVERGLRLRPKSPWLLQSKFQIECAGGDWRQARETLAASGRSRLISKAQMQRRRGVLALAEANGAAAQGNVQQALSFAQEALKCAPELVPAAVLAAQLLQQSGKQSKAERVLEKAWAAAPHPEISARVLEKAWAAAPHPEISAAYSDLVPGESPAQRLIRLRRLIAANPEHVESRLLAAQAALAAGETARARELLQPLSGSRAGDGVSQRVCTLMALLVQAQGGDAAEVQHWLTRAPHAVADPAWTGAA
ncbi:unnamed protein product, partial [Phaeothamnion confervicola]